MLDSLIELNRTANAIVWGFPAVAAIVGVGLWLTCRTRVVQVTRFVAAMRATVGKIFVRQDAGVGAISPFHAVCTALAGTIGTGNIAGVASAVAIGGPMYTIKNGLGGKWIVLAYVYAAFGVLAVFGTGNAAQVNTICASVSSVAVHFFSLSPSRVPTLNLVLGIVLVGVLVAVLLGGIKRIGDVAGKMVPLMALLYFVLAVGVLVMRLDAVPGAFLAIFEGAFAPKAVTGGVVGSVFLSLQKGVSRGIFSNEAGLGSGSIAHACADTEDAVGQGYFGIFEVFMDTIVVCTLTALVILASGTPVTYGQAAGAELTIAGFTSVYGNWVTLLTAVAICFFAFTTALGWGLYGSRCTEFVFGNRAVKPFLFLYSLVSVLGATVDLGVVWDFADTFNGLMAVPNLVALFLLSGKLVEIMRERRSEGKSA